MKAYLIFLIFAAFWGWAGAYYDHLLIKDGARMSFETKTVGNVIVGLAMFFSIVFFSPVTELLRFSVLCLISCIVWTIFQDGFLGLYLKKGWCYLGTGTWDEAMRNTFHGNRSFMFWRVGYVIFFSLIYFAL